MILQADGIALYEYLPPWSMKSSDDESWGERRLEHLKAAGWFRSTQHTAEYQFEWYRKYVTLSVTRYPHKQDASRFRRNCTRRMTWFSITVLSKSICIVDSWIRCFISRLLSSAIGNEILAHAKLRIVFSRKVTELYLTSNFYTLYFAPC